MTIMTTKRRRECSGARISGVGWFISTRRTRRRARRRTSKSQGCGDLKLAIDGMGSRMFNAGSDCAAKSCLQLQAYVHHGMARHDSTVFFPHRSRSYA